MKKNSKCEPRCIQNQQTNSTHPKTSFSEIMSKFLKTCDLEIHVVHTQF